ncbi:hypothetical protein EYF80_067461 [Liparis tanakae]|uniref:Uncharacterized protein n=1 Tax=Liparis tanakae TaxID=230148 RepID=A0A4Z2E0X6_9TELE|nr:hypothetical protein EYF80_067461 [Liparis tanakae]
MLHDTATKRACPSLEWVDGILRSLPLTEGSGGCLYHLFLPIGQIDSCIGCLALSLTLPGWAFVNIRSFLSHSGSITFIGVALDAATKRICPSLKRVDGILRSIPLSEWAGSGLLSSFPFLSGKFLGCCRYALCMEGLTAFTRAHRHKTGVTVMPSDLSP